VSWNLEGIYWNLIDFRRAATITPTASYKWWASSFIAAKLNIINTVATLKNIINFNIYLISSGKRQGRNLVKDLGSSDITAITPIGLGATIMLQTIAIVTIVTIVAIVAIKEIVDIRPVAERLTIF
jgi:hypothetical protein